MQKLILNTLVCPNCQSSLIEDEQYLNCKKCSQRYPVIDDNIIVFLTKKDLDNFSSDGAGAEYIVDDYGTFLTNETSLSQFNEIAQKEKAQARGEKIRGSLYEDDSLPESLSLALNKSRRILAEKVDANRAKKILDCPTGPGSFLTDLLEVVLDDSVIFSTDINFGRLIRTKEYLIDHPKPKNIVYVVGDALRLPFRNNTFDAITSWGITDIPDQKTLIEELADILKKGAKIGFSTDQYKEGSESIKIAENLKIADIVTKKRIEELFKRVGLKNLEYAILWEGQDIDFDVPDEERCPLPARGDYYQFIVAVAEK